MERTEKRVDRASILIEASPERVYRAFVDPSALAQWLPPTGAHAIIDAFEPHAGGSLRVTLVFDAHQGKTTDNSDVVDGRFVELIPDKRIVWAIDFVADDPAFAGTMTMTWTFSPEGAGTRVAVAATDVPSGIRPEDHQQGLASSLANLAAYCQSRNGFPRTRE
ncbi:uncharacterized protein YndB with AHSA1/START domain [Povalibacter uvarum]|uniref:Uncharacterized protein YndB with AHSA1/START domain n=1 Tax=Povalibacter uvarum TaxID=732238 RepID=A0A841HS46_9GAMM|nr:SRPBCC family protein [Povalibacter uvarum]MBB6095474.1 uncharacterized protein YndB with AHSA1/START domain [Povalibacter uvarum]